MVCMAVARESVATLTNHFADAISLYLCKKNRLSCIHIKLTKMQISLQISAQSDQCLCYSLPANYQACNQAEARNSVWPSTSYGHTSYVNVIRPLLFASKEVGILAKIPTFLLANNKGANQLHYRAV